MAALQVYWVDLASRLAVEDVAERRRAGRVSGVRHAAGGERRAHRPTIPGLSLSALRPVCDGMAHGARDLQPLPERRRASPISRSKAAPEATSAPSAATPAGPIARSSTRKRTRRGACGGRSRKPCARPAAERSRLSPRQRQPAALAPADLLTITPARVRHSAIAPRVSCPENIGQIGPSRPLALTVHPHRT